MFVPETGPVEEETAAAVAWLESDHGVMVFRYRGPEAVRAMAEVIDDHEICLCEEGGWIRPSITWRWDPDFVLDEKEYLRSGMIEHDWRIDD